MMHDPVEVIIPSSIDVSNLESSLVEPFASTASILPLQNPNITQIEVKSLVTEPLYSTASATAFLSTKPRPLGKR